MITSWSPSRFDKYQTCPLKAKLEIIDKLCPLCFKGKLMGYETTTCDTCGKSPVKAAPLERGSLLGKSLENYINGTEDELHPEIRHPEVHKIAKKLRAAFKKKLVLIEHDILLDREWRPVRDGWDPKVWLRTKLDVLHQEDPKTWHVLDWKSGGIDKRTGEVRADAKYQDQLSIYNVAALSSFPGVQAVRSTLVFIDAGPRFPCDVAGPTLTAKDLPKSQEKWAHRVKAMLSDKLFAPRPGNYCRYCSFRKEVSGVCQY